MITFNTLLTEEGIKPAKVRLVRHQDRRYETTPYDLWRAGGSAFELYQRIQARPVFATCRYIASFVATPLDETVFAGLFAVNGVGRAPSGLTDPLSGQDVGGHYPYELSAASALSTYRGRVIISWGLGFRSWVQRADAQPKPIEEIRRTMTEPPFPGFLHFSERLTALATVPLKWREALSAVSGVYLLTCPKTGKHYVGSAGGVRGFWGRWENYAASGHGGNRLMKDLPPSDYQITILEVASSTVTIEDLIERENLWKQKLLSRHFGLNAN